MEYPKEGSGRDDAAMASRQVNAPAGSDASHRRVLGIEMVSVDSSNIAEIGYADGVLLVQFKDRGTPYRYRDVPPGLHAELMAAESKGRYLMRRILFGSPYVCDRLTSADLAADPPVK